MNRHTRNYVIMFVSILLGVITGLVNQRFFTAAAELVSGLFLNYLSMIAAPIILLSIVSTFINMRGFEELKNLGKKVITYTLITTVLASIVALGFFLALDPVSSAQKGGETLVNLEQTSYLHFLMEIVPSTFSYFPRRQFFGF